MGRVPRGKTQPQEQAGRKGTPDSRDRQQPQHSPEEESRQKLEKQAEIMGRFLNILSHFILPASRHTFHIIQVEFQLPSQHLFHTLSLSEKKKNP